MDIKRLVEHLCCDLDRGFLEDFAKPYIKKDVRKVNRFELENIYYAVKVLNLTENGKFEICLCDDVSESCDGKKYTAQEVIEYVRKKTLFWWADESEYPITKDIFHKKVIIKRVC